MKIECPKCGTVGVLQKRGNSYRVQHYEGFKDGKRLYAYHAVDKSAFEIMEVNGSKTVEVKSLEKMSKMVREVGFEPTNLYRIGASVLRL